VVRVEAIRKRLNKLDEYLSILYRLRAYTLPDFLADPEHYGSAERFLQLAIETITDIGNHVIADLGLGVVNWYSDIPSILAERGHIDAAQKEKWVRMIGFRNILVHEYLEVDRKIVYDVLQHGLNDLEEIKQALALFL